MKCRFCEGNSSWSGLCLDCLGDGEYIPMHHAVGDRIRWASNPAMDAPRHISIQEALHDFRDFSNDNPELTVIATGHDHCVVKIPPRNSLAIFSYYTNTLTPYVTETHNTKTIMNKTVPLAELANYVNDQSVMAVEGYMTGLYEPKTGIIGKGTQKGKSWHLQGAVITDDNQDEHEVTFGSQEVLQDVAHKGERVRIESTVSQKGTNGLRLVVETYKNKEGEEVTARKLKVTPAAKITWLGENPGSGNSGSSKSNGSPAPARNVQSRSASKVSERVSDYLKVFKEVRVQFGDDLALPEQKDIATTIFLSYKDRDGNINVVFEAATEPAPSTEPSSPEPAKIESWKEVFHVKRKKKLGDMTDEELIPLIQWAYTAQLGSDKLEAKRLQASLLIAAVEKKWTARRILEMAITSHEGYDSVFKDSGIETWVQETYGVKFNKLLEDNAIDALRNFDSMIICASTTATPAQEDDSIPD